MTLLEETLQNIYPLKKEALGSKIHFPRYLGEDIGELENILRRYLLITGEKKPKIPKRVSIISCSDHGVAQMKVSAYPPETTLHMTKTYLIAKGGVANAMANFAKSHLIIADLGIAVDTKNIEGLLDRKIAFGTKNCAKGPAMTRTEAIKAIEIGIAFADEYAKKGYRCFLPGEMGIANTTSAAAIVAVLCNLTPKEATGRGTNISDERLKLKIAVVEEALKINNPNPQDGIDVLSKVGGFELASIVGIILGAAKNHSLTILDGFNTGAAALIAQALSPHITDYLLGSHLAAEQAHQKILAKLHLPVYMNMNFRLGEATGSSIAVKLLDAAILAYENSKNTSIPQPFPLVQQIASFDKFSLEKMLLAESFAAPDENIKEECQFHIDNLAKPIYSMGRLEEVAVKVATTLKNPCPKIENNRLILIMAKEVNEEKIRLLEAFSKNAKSDVFLFNPTGKELDDVFSDTYCTLKKFLHAKKVSIFAPTLAEEKDDKETLYNLVKHLLLADKKDFFTNLRRDEKISLGIKKKIFSYTAAVLAGLSQHALIVLDDALSEYIASSLEENIPSIAPYILHVQDNLLNLHIQANGGIIASLGMNIIDAALHMLNDMKTFAEAGVAIANDGPGKGRQVDK